MDPERLAPRWNVRCGEGRQRLSELAGRPLCRIYPVVLAQVSSLTRRMCREAERILIPDAGPCEILQCLDNCSIVFQRGPGTNAAVHQRMSSTR